MIKASAAYSAIPASLRLFGQPPLLEGEDPSAYNELLARVSGAVKPADVFEEMWVDDVVRLTWEISRLNRLKSNLITSYAYKGIYSALLPKRGYPEASIASDNWASGNPDAIKAAKEKLASVGISMDAVMALTFAIKIDDIERIDRLAMNAEIRRNAALREIERHRSNFAQALRQASNGVVDAEFKHIEAPQLGNQEAA